MDQKYIESTLEFTDFVQDCPSCYHVVSNVAQLLEDNGFVALDESKSWHLEKGESYFVTRNGSAIIAFCLPQQEPEGFAIVSSHTDSPTFKVKENPEVTTGPFCTINVEGYGGMLMGPWFDRPLSIAGRAFVKSYESDESDRYEIKARLVDLDRNLCQITSLCKHQNKDANSGYAFSVQKDMMPILGMGCESGQLRKLVAQSLDVDESDIVDMELFLYNRQTPVIWGHDDEFFSSSRIDDLQCAFASVKALLESGASGSSRIQMVVLLDNEEVGSGTKQGAAGDFLSQTVNRIEACLGCDYEKKCIMQAQSFMLSADNGHSLHPNYPEKCDITNRPVVNGGVLIKYAGNQKYTTDAFSGAYLKDLFSRKNIRYQVFFNHSNVPGGSTLGNISMTQFSIPSVDIGCAQLAMHSPYETAGTMDTLNLTEGMLAFYEA